MVSVSVPIVSLVPIDLTNTQKVITRVWIPYVSSEHTNNTLKTALEKYNVFYGLNLQISSLELRIETFKSLGVRSNLTITKLLMREFTANNVFIKIEPYPRLHQRTRCAQELSQSIQQIEIWFHRCRSTEFPENI